MYEPRRIVVLGLTPATTADDVLEFFAQYGTVTAAILKRQPGNVYAFVEFASEAEARDVLRRERYLFADRVVVRVLRAFNKMWRLPSRPFPGMDARTSPVRVAIQHGLLHDEDNSLCHAIQSIWAM